KKKLPGQGLLLRPRHGGFYVQSRTHLEHTGGKVASMNRDHRSQFYLLRPHRNRPLEIDDCLELPRYWSARHGLRAGTERGLLNIVALAHGLRVRPARLLEPIP